jgi:nucleoside-diphosphate-sugar epimerase
MRALVTGGGGFLGRAVARRLVDRGDDVVSLARGDYPELADLGVDARRGDLADPDAVAAAVRGCDAVFHVAAKAGVWGSYDEYFRPNVIGTQNVIDACRAHGVGRLVYTSSPSVVHAGRPLAGVDESPPYPDRFESHYPATKCLAEQKALAADSPDLAAVALRPHLIWGPGDTNITPRLIERRRANKLVKISGGPYRVDSTFIDNAAEAHVQALDRLEPGRPPAGRAYFISNDEPMDVFELIDRIVGAAGLPPVEKTVSPRTAYAAGWVMETIWRLFRRPGEPPMTRFVAKQLTTDHYFDLTAARRDLGYNPRISVRQGLEILRESLSGPSAG